MRLPSRKLTFQLTPLLDLLLIVLFAQYMEASRTHQEQAVQNEYRLQEELSTERDLLKTKMEELAEDQSKLIAEGKRLSESKQKLQQDEKDLQRKLKDILNQQTRAGDTAAELFQLPDALVEQALKPLKKNRSAEEIEEIRKAFRNLAKKRGTAVIRHLLTYEELRKRCDIWQLHIQENGEIHFFTGKELLKFRAETSQQFEQKLFNQYKKVPQPKGLVIILLSVGNIGEGIEKAALAGLPLATERMRSDSNGRTRFEFALLGYTAKSPIPTE